MSKKLKWKKLWSGFWPYLIFVISALFILWSQKNNQAFFVGEDSWFHMNQVYETAMQIKAGHFSWFLTLFSFGQVGRIVDALYGPLFSYLMGALLLLVGTWTRFQLTMSFVILCVSGMTMYHLSRFVKIRRSLSLLLGLIYMSSAPITEFVNEQTFGGVGNAILPLVILEGLKLWKSHKVNVIPLAVLLAIILQIHLMSAVVATVALIPFGMISFIQSKYKFNWIKRLFCAILIFFLLTFNIWGTFLDVFHRNNIIKPFPVMSMNNPGVSLGWIHGTISILNPIYIVMGAIVISLLIIEWHRLNKDQKFIPILSLIFIWLSSTYFPWTIIEHRALFLSQSLQFPDRFLGIGVILFLLTLGLGVSRLQLNNDVLSVIIFLVLTLITMTSITTEEGLVEKNVHIWNSKRVFLSSNSNFHPKMPVQKLRRVYNSKDLNLAHQDTIKSISDYLPSNTSSNAKTYRQIHPKSRALRELFRVRITNHSFKHSQRKRNHKVKTWKSASAIKSPFHFKKSVSHDELIVRWNQPKRLSKHNTQLPIVKYNHTIINVNSHHSPVKIDKVGAVHLHPKAGKNKLVLRYQASKIWIGMMIISIISWISLALCWISLKARLIFQNK